MSKEHVHDSVREEFRKLNLDGKTAFLVEAIFSTAGSAINEIGSRLNGLVQLVSEPFEASAADEASESDAESDAPPEESAADAEPAPKKRRTRSRTTRKK